MLHQVTFQFAPSNSQIRVCHRFFTTLLEGLMSYFTLKFSRLLCKGQCSAGISFCTAAWWVSKGLGLGTVIDLAYVFLLPMIQCIVMAWTQRPGHRWFGHLGFGWPLSRIKTSQIEGWMTCLNTLIKENLLNSCGRCKWRIWRRWQFLEQSGSIKERYGNCYCRKKYRVNTCIFICKCGTCWVTMLFHVKTHGFHEAILKHEKTFSLIKTCYYFELYPCSYLSLNHLYMQWQTPTPRHSHYIWKYTSSFTVTICMYTMHATYLQHIKIALQHSDYIVLLINPVSKTYTHYSPW